MVPGAKSVVEEILSDDRLGGRVAHHRHLPGAGAAYAALDLDDRLASVLRGQGVDRFFTHQVEAIEALRRGENVVVMTPTASGKSLVYHVAILEAILARPESRALCTFPLKGLERDQVDKANALLRPLGLCPAPRPRERAPLEGAEIYDGDTTPHRRRKIRERTPNVVFTTPDMIHLALGPYHPGWEELFSNLDYVVIDEIHTYTGLFGSHAAQIFRRLRRICERYGSRPRFIACSATIANPADLAERLTGLSFTAVTESGAPRSGTHFLMVDPDDSPYTAASRLFVRLLRAGLKTIAFTGSRRMTELLYRFTTERAPEIEDRVSSYRAGFLPGERREIEGKLFSGELAGVVSTSALELGVDVGGLDACLLVGYPGSIASTWQRAGRVGRRGRESMVVLVAQRDALDRYFLRHPEAFFGASHEAVVIDPDNRKTLEQHLPIAAAEVYLRESDTVYPVPALLPVLEALEEAGVMRRGRRGDIWFARRRHPERDVGIRAIGETFAVYRQGGGKLGELDGARVLRDAFPGAIYLHRGLSYRVVELDLERRRVLCRPGPKNRTTRALTSEDTRIRDEHERTETALSDCDAARGRLETTRRVVGFEERQAFTGRHLRRGELRLPSTTFETEGLWLELRPGLRSMFQESGADLAGSLHAAEHAAIKCLPLFVVCDKRDVGGLSYPYYPPLGAPAVFIYDGYEGGVGYTRRAFEVLEPWLRATLDLLAECECERGCPACVQDPQCGSANEPLDKAGARAFLAHLLGAALD